MQSWYQKSGHSVLPWLYTVSRFLSICILDSHAPAAAGLIINASVATTALKKHLDSFPSSLYLCILSELIFDNRIFNLQSDDDARNKADVSLVPICEKGDGNAILAGGVGHIPFIVCLLVVCGLAQILYVSSCRRSIFLELGLDLQSDDARQKADSNMYIVQTAGATATNATWTISTTEMMHKGQHSQF